MASLPSINRPGHGTTSPPSKAKQFSGNFLRDHRQQHQCRSFPVSSAEEATSSTHSLWRYGIPSIMASPQVSAANAQIDWKEAPQAHVFKADLPGLKKEEVKVELEEGRVLKISGERSRENEEKGEKWHRVERSSGKFLRRFRLPENAKVEEMKASMENGVLTVTVPKVEEKKPEVKFIEISG